MDQVEIAKTIQDELTTLMPKGLSDAEQATWKMIFNALRLNDLSKAKPSEGDIVALHAAVETVMRVDCGQKTFAATDDGKIAVVTYTSPKIDIKSFVDSKSLFTLWGSATAARSF